MIPKSRYDSIDSFLSNCCNKWDGYNDIEVYHGDDDADGEADDNELRFTCEVLTVPRGQSTTLMKGVVRPRDLRAALGRGG